MRSREQKQYSKRLYANFYELYMRGQVRRYGYYDLEATTADQTLIRVDISSAGAFPKCTMSANRNAFSHFGWRERRALMKMYKKITKDGNQSENNKAAKALLDVLDTPEKIVREAAAEVKTWI